MASYPVLSSGQSALYPVTRGIRYRTAVRVALKDTEQRWNQAAALNDWILEYRDLSAADRQLIQDFRDVTKGTFDTTWDITLGGQLYEFCTFTEQEFRPEERTAEQWDFRIGIRQVAPSGLPSVPPPAAFPVLQGNVTTHRPWWFDRRYHNSIVDMPTGRRYAYNHRATPRLPWRVGGESLSDSDATELLEFFIGVQSRWRTFSFTDPETGQIHSKCRLRNERFEVRHLGPNENSAYLEVYEIIP